MSSEKALFYAGFWSCEVAFVGYLVHLWRLPKAQEDDLFLSQIQTVETQGVGDNKDRREGHGARGDGWGEGPTK